VGDYGQERGSVNGTPIHHKGLAVGRFQYFGTVAGKLTLFAICRSAMLFSATAVDGLNEKLKPHSFPPRPNNAPLTSRHLPVF